VVEKVARAGGERNDVRQEKSIEKKKEENQGKKKIFHQEEETVTCKRKISNKTERDRRAL